MNTFLIIGIGGGIVLGVFLIISSKKDDKSSKPVKKLEDKVVELDAKSNDESKTNVVGESKSSEQEAIVSKIIEGKQNSSKPNAEINNLSSADKQIIDETKPIRKDILEEEIKENKIVNEEIKELKGMLKLIERVDEKLVVLEHDIRSTEFPMKMKMPVFYQYFANNIVLALYDLFKELELTTKNIQKNVGDLLESNRKMIIDSRKLIDADESLKVKFNEVEHGLMVDVEKSLHAGGLKEFNSMKILGENFKKCADVTFSIKEQCDFMFNHDPEGGFKKAFDKRNGLYWKQLKRKLLKDLFSNYAVAINDEKVLLDLLNKLRNTFEKSLAA